MPSSEPRSDPLRKRLTDRFIANLPKPETRKIFWDTVQAGLGLKVMPTGTKTFIAVYRHGGRPRWYSLGRYPRIGLKEARQAARVIMARAAIGEDPQTEKMETRQGETLRELQQRYLKEHARRTNKSWRQADALMRGYVLGTLGARKAKDITRRDVRRIFNELTIAKVRPVLANQVLAAISAVFTWAVKQDILTDNPARGIDRNKTNGSERALSDAEIARVWPELDELGLFGATALRLILLTAQRPGEVCAMRWQDVDPEARTWTLPGEPATGWPGTKNGRRHTVPLTDSAVELLREFDPQANGPVFPGRGDRPMSIPAAGAIWKALEIPRFRPHDLRATAASGMDRLGVPKEHISRILNHVEGGVTAGYIRHEAEQQKRRALEAWGARVDQIVTGGAAPETVVELERGGMVR